MYLIRGQIQVASEIFETWGLIQFKTCILKNAEEKWIYKSL